MQRILLSVSLMGALLAVEAQTCTGYFPLETGVKFEITHYDNKDKLSSRVTYDIKESGNRNGGRYAKIDTRIDPLKGEPSFGHFYADCKDDIVLLDIRALIPSEIMTPYQDMEATITGDALQIPSNLKVGQTLPDASAAITLSSGPIPMRMSVVIRDRKVLAEESVTTSAGTFKCFKIQESDEVKFGVTVKYTSTQWICPGIGMVKQTSVRSNGKSMGRSELTQFSRP